MLRDETGAGRGAAVIGRGIESIAGPARAGSLARAVLGHAHVPDHVLVGSKARLLVDKSEVLPDILDTVARAERSVEVAEYILQPTAEGRAVLEALRVRARGLDGRPPIDVAVVVDRQGSAQFPLLPQRRYFEQLERDGVRVAVHRGPLNPLRGGVEHRKLFVADGQVAHVGGMGLGAGTSWHDVMVRLEGPVAAQAHAEFVGRWVDLGGAVSPVQLAMLREADAAGQHPAAVGARLVSNTPGGPLRVTDAALDMARHARERLWVHTPYLGARAASDALVRAGHDGVDARIAVTGSGTAFPVAPMLSRTWYDDLVGRDGAVGVRVLEQQRMSHEKIVLADEWVTTGSTNMTERALYGDHELNVVSNDPVLHAQVARMMLADEAAAIRIGADDLDRPSVRFATSDLGAAVIRGTVGRVA